MNEKSISYMENKIKKMQKTADGLNRLINSSTSLKENERKNVERLKRTTLKEIRQTKEELHSLKKMKET
jgi:hypothetical protein